jgi:hypothetical protein
MAINQHAEFGPEIASRNTGICAKLISSWVRDKSHILSQNSARRRFRLGGGGRTTPFSKLEASLFAWIKEQRSKRCMVSYTSCRTKALALKSDLGDVNEFRASPSWMRGFLQRYNLGYRLPTHTAQQNNKPPEIKCQQALRYLRNVCIYFIFYIR